MESNDSDSDYEIIINVLVNRRPRIFRPRQNFFTYYDEFDFRQRYRVSKQTAWSILELIRHKIAHKTTRNRAMSPEEMLLLTLRFYATGYMQRSGGDLSGVSSSTASRVIRRVSHNIAMLRENFINFPSEGEEQFQVQRDFYKIAKFPRVIAAIDCTHVKISSPGGKHAELFRNRKGFFSFNVQTLCDSKLNIMDIVARWPGSTHDATILRNSRIYSRFEANEFGNTVIVADGGYPCNRYLMTPLSKVSTPAEALFNESLIRTRNCAERSYGVWKRRFPVLSLGIRMNVKQVQSVIVATAVMHNVCNLTNDRDAPPLLDEMKTAIDAVLEMPVAPISQTDNSYRNEIILNHFYQM